MSKLLAILVSSAATSAFLLACTSVDTFVEQAYDAGAATPVQFNFDAVTPQTVTIPSGGNVTWLNNGLDVVGFVIFPHSIAGKFSCTDLYPYLTLLEDGNYRSPPITGVVSEHAKLPCALAPGSYDYEIWLMGQGFGDEAAPGRSVGPQKVLRGTLIVSKPPPPPAAPPAQATPPALPGGY
jgi:hypothetical protein